MKNPFIPAWLDEASLDPYAFRVMCHIYRRGELYGSAKEAAKVCKMDRKRIFKSLSDLQKIGLISKVTRQGQTSVYIASPVPKVEQVTRSESGTGKRLTRAENGTPPVPKVEHLPVPKVEHKGNPIKDTPIKVIKEGDTAIEITLPFKSEKFKQAWNEWLDHKKAVRQKMPMTTISAQLKKISKWGEDQAIQSIENSIASNWQGLFEVKQSNQPTQKPKFSDSFNEHQHLIDTMP